jgi:3-hydroxyisobutyrate dehydrogenase
MRAAVLGTGIMGAAMARSLARDGHQVAVWNRTPERAEAVAGGGITSYRGVREAVDGADAVITVLFDADSVLAVADDLVAALGDDAVWLQTSTVGPDGMTRIAAAVPAAAGRLLDAPVLGTRKPAEDGTLVVLLSGPDTARARVGWAVDAIGSRTLVVGDDLGQASSLKIVCNSWVATMCAAVGQATGLAGVLGLDPRLFLEAIGGGPVDTPYAHVKGAAMMAGTYTPTAFSVDGVVKDVGLMVTAAHETGFRDDLLLAVLGLFERAADAGHGDHDMAAVRTSYDVEV